MKKRLFAIKIKVPASFLLKLILIYSVIMLFSFSMLTLFISNLVSDILIKKEINFENLITKRVLDYLDETIISSKNIINNIYINDKDKRTSIFTFLDNEEEYLSYEKFSDKERFDTFFSSSLMQGNNILDIMVYKKKTHEMFSYARNSRKAIKDYHWENYPWFSNTLHKRELLSIIPTYYPQYIQKDKRPVYTVIANVFNELYESSCVIMINMSANGLEKSYSEYKKDIKGFIMAFDSTGSVMYDSTGKYYSQRYPYYEKLKAGTKFVMLEKESVVSISKSAASGMMVVGIIPKSEILKSMEAIINTIYLALALSLLISLILIFVASRYFSRRIRMITNAMKKVEKGNLETRIHTGKSKDEIHQISTSFNNMCEQLQNYINKVYIAEIQKKDAEFTALQTQINPHFLYNTLETIRMKAIIGDTDDVSDMISILADLFRAAVKSKDMVVRINDEIDYCQSYLEIHRIRLGERLKVVFDVQNEILDYAIPKLILQPLVENALAHGGLNTNMDTITITILGYKQDEDIMIEVADNGLGIDEVTLCKIKKELEETKNIKNGESIGMKNINDRIRIIFGNNYGLELFSCINIGTRVVIKLPAKNLKEINRNVQDTNCG